jgi:hypothetical protein
MVRHLLGNACGSFSVNKFYNDTRSQGLQISKDTLHEYFSFLEDAFLIRTVSIDSKSERRRMVNPRKVYPIDSGLIPIYDRTGQSGFGHALETCVLIELDRRGAEIAYVRTPAGFEVDFRVIYPEGGEELFQVCADLDDPAVRNREIRALQDAGSEYPHARRTIVSLHPESIHDLPKGIKNWSAAEWLMGGRTLD